MASEKPAVAVGQRWRGELSGNEFRVVDKDSDFPDRWVIKYVNSISEQRNSTVYNNDFLGWLPGYEPAPASSGSKAADWLRGVAKVLEEKSVSYGDSVGNPMRVFSKAGVTEGIKVRIDDKLSRVARGKEWPGDDVIVDLVGYLALLAVCEEK